MVAPGPLALEHAEEEGGRARGPLSICARRDCPLFLSTRMSAGGFVVESANIASKGLRLETVREQAEREHILSVLKQTDGNRAQAARILGISRKTLWKKLKHLGVSWPPGSPIGGSD